MKKLIVSLLFVLPYLSSISVLAEGSRILPGEYERDGGSGSGNLRIEAKEKNRLTFHIQTIGGNCHSCDVTGMISGSIGHPDPDYEVQDGTKCDIAFSVKGSAIAVLPNDVEACRMFCGMRADFRGTYRIPPVNCTSDGQKLLHERFLSLYKAHQFTEAKNTLQKQMTQCKNFMNWIEIDKVRNDIALAQYHNGEPKQCLITLNSTLASRVKDEDELKSGNGNVYLPPCDFDNYIDVAKSTWFNKALCTKALSK